METNNFYEQVYSFENLLLAYKKARKNKSQKPYVIEFEKNLPKNLFSLYTELKNETYQPKPLETFIIRDPKTRRISKSDFRDRIVHHAIVNILEPIYEKVFTYDSSANRINKGVLFALTRFDFFKRKVTKNNTRNCFVLKADIKHYFEEVVHQILINILQRKINCSKVISLINKILVNYEGGAITKKECLWVI